MNGAIHGQGARAAPERPVVRAAYPPRRRPSVRGRARVRLGSDSLFTSRSRFFLGNDSSLNTEFSRPVEINGVVRTLADKRRAAARAGA